nr:phospholipase [Micromonospora sp. DSM 115978]
MHQHNLGASGTGSVVLELGGDTGALIIYTGQEWHGREIEISLVGSAGGPRTHSAVRERRVRDGVFFSAVYPELPAGTYTVWRDGLAVAGEVTVPGGGVVEFAWPTRSAR